jgi:uncharacterized membrane protein YcaP (DUF421 family)
MDIVLRASAMFAILFLLIRLLGKRELSQLTPFDMLMLVVMGDLIQQGVTHNDYSVTGAALAITTFGFWSLVLSWVTYLSPWAEKLVDGRPRVIVREGELLTGSLRSDRLTRAEVESEMRLAGIASIKEVAWAILEPQGKISFIRKEQSGPSDQKDKPGVE